MNFTTKLKTGLATLALVTSMNVANATTVDTTTISTPMPEQGTVMFDISKFDTNGDNFYDMEEIGAKLFYIYDTDGNEIIDNNEFEKKSIMTFVPMKEEQYTMVDTNNDGVAEKTSYSYTEFVRDTGLSIYDENKDGLSAKEFIAEDFSVLDKNDDNLVDIKEWKSVYLDNVKALKEVDKYN